MCARLYQTILEIEISRLNNMAVDLKKVTIQWGKTYIKQKINTQYDKKICEYIWEQSREILTKCQENLLLLEVDYIYTSS